MQIISLPRLNYGRSNIIAILIANILPCKLWYKRRKPDKLESRGQRYLLFFDHPTVGLHAFDGLMDQVAMVDED